MIALHAIGNAVLLWLAYYWLGVGESTVPRLVWSAALALMIVCAALVLQGGAHAGSVKTAARNLLPLLAIALVAGLLYAGLAWWSGAISDEAVRAGSWLTLKTRKPVKPENIERALRIVLWLMRWVVAPWLVVPVASAAASAGFGAFRLSSWRRKALYWLWMPALVVIALWAPLRLMGWVPQIENFWGQMASFAARAVVAYLLLTGGLLVLARLSRDSAGQTPN